MKKLLSLLMIPVFAFGLGSCRDMPKDFCKQGKYNGDDVEIGINGWEKGINLSDGKGTIFATGDVISNFN